MDIAAQGGLAGLARTVDWPKALTWTAVASVVAYGLLLALFSLPGYPHAVHGGMHMPFLLDKPVGEDGFYMMLVAWNMALGKGIVGNFDQAVTGIQPLATFVYAALAKGVLLAGGDKSTFVRAVIAFGTLNLLWFAHLLGLLAKSLVGGRDATQVTQRQAYLLAVAMTALSFHAFRTFTYGLETGMYLLLFAQVVRMSFAYVGRPPDTPWCHQNVVMGLMVGVTALARVDFIVVFAGFAALALWNRAARWQNVCVVGVVAAFVFLPWPVHVWQVSGSPIPSSGPAQGALITLSAAPERLAMMGHALVQNLLPGLFTNSRWEVALVSVLVMALAWPWRDRQLPGQNQRVARWWWLTLFFLAAVYVLCIWATHFYARYTAPLMVLAVPLAAASLANRLAGPRAKQATVCVVAALGVAFLAFTVFVMHRGKLGNPHIISAGVVHERYAHVAQVGAFQSGVVGFDNTNVVNLDGKVNTAVLPYVKLGNIDAYLLAHPEIGVLIDWPRYIHTYVSDAHLAQHWRPCAQGVPEGISVCYERVAPARAHGTP